MFMTPEFWVFVAFLLFFVLLGRKLFTAIFGMLDDRAARIRRELDEAQKLREDAAATLAAYQARQADALKEAEAILAHARDEAARLGQRAAAELDASLKRREQQAADRIAQAEAQAIAEVRNMTVDLAIAASRRLLSEGIAPAQQTRLVDDAIAGLPKALH